VHKGYVTGPFGQIHYRRMGEGPPVVLLHQTSWSSWQFINALPALAGAGLDAIAFDTPGYGQSDTPPAPPSIEDYADAIAAGIEQLGLARPAVAGHHTGAFIACALAHRHAETVAKAVLCNMPVYTDAERKERLDKPHFDQTPRADGSHFTDRWKLATDVMAGRAELTSIHHSLLQFFTTGEKEWYGHHAAFSYDAEPALRDISVPVLIQSNTGDMTHDLTIRALDRRPDFAYAELDGGSAHIVFEDAARWAGPVIGFIKGNDP